jgi:hypothetical protein
MPHQKAFIAFSFFLYLLLQPGFILIKSAQLFKLSWFGVLSPLWMIVLMILVSVVMHQRRELKYPSAPREQA